MNTTPCDNRFKISPEVEDRINPARIPEPWRSEIETAAQKLPEECQRNQTLFWSGSPNRHFTDYSMNRAAAEIWAEWHDKKTLEMTSLGRLVDKAYENQNLTDQEKYEISKYASSIYAQNARGEVTAFVREARFDGHYAQIERPSLVKEETQLTEMTFGLGRLEHEMQIINNKLKLDMYQYHTDLGMIKDNDQKIAQAYQRYSQSCRDYTHAYHDVAWPEAKDRLQHYQQVLEECKSYESTHPFDRKGIAERQTMTKDLENDLQKYPTTKALLERQDVRQEHSQETKENLYSWQPKSKLGQKLQKEHQQKDVHQTKDSFGMEK